MLVLTGAGDRAFCAGGDLKEMADTALKVPPPDFLPQFGRNIEVAKPTIAAVNGVAYAGGFLLAQSCDLCVAAESARFAVTEVKVGRGSPWAAPLPWLIPPRIAMEILLTGDPLSAAAGLRGRPGQPGRAGRASCARAAQALAERIAANAPLSVLAAKRTVYLSAEHSAERGLRRSGPDLGAGLPQRRRPGGPGRVPRQAAPGLDGPLMAADARPLVPTGTGR